MYATLLAIYLASIFGAYGPFSDEGQEATLPLLA